MSFATNMYANKTKIWELLKSTHLFIGSTTLITLTKFRIFSIWYHTAAQTQMHDTFSFVLLYIIRYAKSMFRPPIRSWIPEIESRRARSHRNNLLNRQVRGASVFPGAGERRGPLYLRLPLRRVCMLHRAKVSRRTHASRPFPLSPRNQRICAPVSYTTSPLLLPP